MVKNKVLVALKDVVKQIDLSEEDIVELIIDHHHIHLFDDVADFREKGKIRYELSDILMMAFIVILEKGKQSFYYMSRYVGFHINRFEKLGLIEDGNVPSHDTFRRVFSLLDSDSLIETTIMRFYELLKSFEEQKGLSHIGVDGKYINGSGRKDDTKKPSRNVNVLNIYDSSLGTCIVSVPVEDKTNEIPIAQELLSSMDLKNDLITADALHCQGDTTKAIRSKGGHYLLTVRDNQPLLLQDIMVRFDKKANQKKIIRLEKEEDSRIIEILRLPSGFEYEKFTGIRSYVKMSSHKRKKECIRYYISDLIKKDEILLGIEEHWAIENDLHKLKDDFLHEDSFRCTDKKAIRNIAIMNNLITQLIYIYLPFSGYDLYTAKIALSSDPYKEISRLLAVLSSEKIIEELRKKIKKTNRKRK